MGPDQILPADERRHPAGGGSDWEESWYLDFVDGGGGLAGYVRLTLRPGEGTAWFWAGMVGGGPRHPAQQGPLGPSHPAQQGPLGPRLVAVRDHEVPPPAGRGLEVRASGLWTEFVCETALDHWSVGLEAFGVALDDPLEAWRQERGDACALGLDVEWEGDEGCVPWPAAGAGYSQACVVHGDVLVGAERFALDGHGTRVHLWGRQPRTGPSGWAAGRMEDGRAFLATDPVVECDDEGRVRSLRVGELTATAVAHAPILVPGEGRLARALCRYEGGGVGGHGWAEWFHPMQRSGGGA